MQILNIDSLVTSSRVLKYKGESYPVEEPTVQQFIDNLKAAEELEKSGVTKTFSESFDTSVKIIVEAIPTLPESEIRAFKLPAMLMVLRFIRGDLDGVAGEGATASAPEGAEKKPS